MIDAVLKSDYYVLKEFMFTLESGVKLRAKNKVDRTKALLRRRQPDHDRLTPITAIFEINGVTITRVPPLDNTRHRYPWLCSLKGINPTSH